MAENKDANKAENKDANKAENKDVSKAKNGDVKNEKNQPSNTPSEQDVKQGGIKSLKVWLTWARTNYRVITAIVIPCIAGIFAFWEGFGQWWFGFDLLLLIYFILPASLLVIWLVAFCGYYGEAHPEKKIEGKEKLRSLSWNVFVMIAIPVLVFSTLLAYVAMKWRLSDKIVILVEPFEEIGEVQDGRASGQGPEGIAETVKSHLEKAIPLSKRLKVRVVLGKRHEKGSGEEMPLEERALKYRADMVISGWYVERGVDPNKEFLVYPKFQVVRVPQPLPAVFRRSGGMYPKTFVFSNKEIENFDVNFTLGTLLTYESMLVLGAGAYASSDWKTAQQFFGTALQEIEKLESPEKGSETKVESPEKDSEAKKRGESNVRHEYLEGDKALLQLYIGHCLMNQSQYENAILRYDDAIEAVKKIPPSDTRYGEILASAYLARGVAYRQTNAFELAGQDFETAGGHLPTSLGLRTMHTEEARFLSGDREKLKIGAKKYYNRGEKYLIQREYKHAQAYLEMSVEFYRRLMKGMPTPVQEEYSLGLAESLVRLGEIHNRLAKPELRDDKNTQQAIEHLDEADRLTGRFSEQKNRNMLKIRADGLRHLGEAYQAMDKIEDVEIAFKYHKEAKEIWGKTMKPNKPEGVANELVRIGNVHRRLDDLLPQPNNGEYTNLKSAIDFYRLSVKTLASVNDDGYRMLFSSVPNNSLDPNSIRDLRKLVKDHVKDEITAHHLANSLRNLAETKLWLGGDPNTGDPNREDLPTICKLLDFATECYEKTICKMEVEEDPNWIEKIRINERNQSLKDDLGWCMTLHSYVLLKKGSGESGNKLDYETLEDKLKKAMRYFEESGNYKKDKDKSEIITNLLILSITQVKLNQKDKARETFSEGCLRLRNLTRKAKKVWYIDYIRDLMRDFRQEYPIKSVDHDTYFSDLEEWLEADTVKKGRYALDKIMEGIEKKFEEGGED